MSKLGLLKDSDFKAMHDRKLPVTFEDFETVEEFCKIVEKDVKFLEGLRIMDYSLFLIVLEVPRPQEENKGEEGANPGETHEQTMYSRHEGSQNFDQTGHSKHFTMQIDDIEQKKKEDDLYNKLEELIKFGRFVMFSPSKRYVYLMGLIDYLGKWNMSKKFEMYGKTLLAHFIRQNTDFSVKPPHEFARRFLRKVKRVFRVEKQDKRQGKFGSQHNSIMDPRMS